MRIDAIIPARGGSKAIPGKNVVGFLGHPLISWTIDCARRCGAVEKVWVSTDDQTIANVARQYGALVIDRPISISGDTASSESALIHAATIISEANSDAPSHFLFLQPTSPLRETCELERAVETLKSGRLDSLFSAAPAEDFCLWNRCAGELTSLNFDYLNRGRRQDRPDDDVWIETGSFYLTAVDGLVRTGNRLHGKIGMQPVEPWKVFEIDSPAGLDLCSAVFSAKLANIVPPPTKQL